MRKEDAKYTEYITVGNKIQVKVINDPELKGYINASFTSAANKLKEMEIKDSIGDDSTAYEAKLLELVSGGYIVKIDDIEAFMPGSLAGVNKIFNFEALIGQTLPVMAVNYDDIRNTVVVSHRKYLHTLIPTTIENLKENLQESITGFVTGCAEYGVFCEFNGCLTGMIHVSDLDDDMKAAHAGRNLKPGTEINFFVKEIVSNKKIILSQSLKVDPWADIQERYSVPCRVVGKITSLKDYGAFIKIEDSVVGLLHESEYEHELTEGDDIHVNITRIDKGSKKIFLTL